MNPLPYTQSRFRGSHRPRCFSFLTPTSRQVRPATRDWPCVVSFASSEAPVRSSDLPQCPCTDGFLTVKSTSCDSCPQTVQSVSWGLPITLFIDEGDPSPINITELWRTPYHFSSPNPCRTCGSLSSSIQRLLGDHAECLILEVIRPQGLSNYLWSKKHHHKTIFPPRLVLHHEFSHQQATESYQLQSVLCVQASEDNAGTIITHTYVPDRQSDRTWIQCDDDSVSPIPTKVAVRLIAVRGVLLLYSRVPATVPDPPPVGAAFQHDPRPILGFRSAQRTNKAYRRQLRKTIRAIKALAKDEQAK
eukprot:g10425.t1